jgi:hypothetical protein
MRYSANVQVIIPTIKRMSPLKKLMGFPLTPKIKKVKIKDK